MLQLGLGLGRSVAAQSALAGLFSGKTGDVWSAASNATLLNGSGVAPAADDAVASWAGGISGTMFSQAAAGARPLWRSAGWLQFDGVDDFLETADLLTGYPLTLALSFDKSFSNTGTPALSSAVAAVNVYRYMSASPSNGVCADRNVANIGSSPSLGYTTSAALQSMFAVFETGGAKALYVEGTETTLFNTNTHASAEKLLLGKFRDAGGFGAFKVRHVLAISDALDATKRQVVRDAWGAL